MCVCVCVYVSFDQTSPLCAETILIPTAVVGTTRGRLRSSASDSSSGGSSRGSTAGSRNNRQEEECQEEEEHYCQAREEGVEEEGVK